MRYIIKNKKNKILYSKSLGMLNIKRKEMRYKKSKEKLGENFLYIIKKIIKHFKKKLKQRKEKLELHFHILRFKYSMYNIFKFYIKEIRKEKKQLKKNKSYLFSQCLNLNK
jgi:methionine synthase II (cobalamin-independent)